MIFPSSYLFEKTKSIIATFFFCKITFSTIAGRSLHPDLKDGGALQVSLVKFQVDYYPYHLAIADRKHWAKYKENATPHSQWLQQSMNSFRGQFMDFIDMGRNQHSPLRHQKNSAGEDFFRIIIIKIRSIAFYRVFIFIFLNYCE